MQLPPEQEYLLAGYDLMMRGIGREPCEATGPMVSVIMPVYNRDWLIEAALESLEKQSWQQFEAVIVDDASTDRTSSVLADWSAKHSWLRVYTNPTRRGAAASRNRALEQARGEIFTYLDSDNLFYPHALEVIVEAFRESPGTWSIYTSQIWNGAQGTFVRCPRLTLSDMTRRSSYDLGAVAHRRELWEALGGFDDQCSRLMDWDLSLRYAHVIMPKRVPVPTSHYRNGDWNRISNEALLNINLARIRRRYSVPSAESTRVLYICEFEKRDATSLAVEIAYFTSNNFRLCLFSPSTTATYPLCQQGAADFIKAKSLDDVIAGFCPDVIHAIGYEGLTSCASIAHDPNIPITLLLDTNDNVVEVRGALNRSLNLKTVFSETTIPNNEFGQGIQVDRVLSTFNSTDDLLWEKKDRLLVLCAADTLEEVRLALSLARRQLDYQFHVVMPEDLVREAESLEASSLINVVFQDGEKRSEVAEKVRQAAIFVDLRTPTEASGLVTSRVCNAMAAGCYTLVRPAIRNTASRDGINYFNSEGELATLVETTKQWSDRHWRSIAIKTSEQAYLRSPDLALRPVADTWIALAKSRYLEPHSATQLCKVAANEKLHFGIGAKGAETIRRGFHRPERWSVWTGQSVATLAFSTEGSSWNDVRAVVIEGHFLTFEEALVQVRVNGVSVGSVMVTNTRFVHRTSLSAVCFRSGMIVVVEFESDLLKSPRDGGGADRRCLGLALRSICFVTND